MKKTDPARDRERMIQFLSVVPALGIIFFLRAVLDSVDWAILAGIVVYYLIGVILERKIPHPPKPENDDGQK